MFNKQQQKELEIEHMREKKRIWLKEHPRFAKLLDGDYSDYGLKIINGCDIVPSDYISPND